MKPKHYIAFAAVVGSLMWFAMMTVSQVETLTTPHARFLFLGPFFIAIFAGMMGLCFLFTEAYRKEK